MKLLLQEIRRNPLLWLLVFVPVALAAEKLNHEAHTLHFILSVLAILPLAILLSHATDESGKLLFHFIEFFPQDCSRIRKRVTGGITVKPELVMLPDHGVATQLINHRGPGSLRIF